MLVEGLNRIRDLWGELLNAAELGTGTNQETADDTDLQTVVSGSETTNITTTTANQFIKKEALFPGTNSGGESVSEMIWKTQSPELASSGVTMTASTWSTTSNTFIETRWFVKGRRG